MNRFVIVDGFPYLFADGKTFTCRFDKDGFTVGTEVELASVPDVTHSELSIKAQCNEHLDSIGKSEQGSKTDIFSGMTVAELKEFAEINSIDIGEAKKKADILAVIRAANKDGGDTE